MPVHGVLYRRSSHGRDIVQLGEMEFFKLVRTGVPWDKKMREDDSDDSDWDWEAREGEREASTGEESESEKGHEANSRPAKRKRA